VNRRTPLGPSLHTVVVHVSASSKLSKKLSVNLEQHSAGTGDLRKRLRMSFEIIEEINHVNASNPAGDAIVAFALP